MEIKFRGLSLKNNEFVYGYFITDELGTCLIVDEIKGIREMVEFKTIEQFTGRKDKDGDVYQKVHLDDGQIDFLEFKSIELLKYLKRVFDCTDSIQPNKIKMYSKDIEKLINEV